MKRMVEHNFCDYCGKMIGNGEDFITMLNKDYHETCITDGIMDMICDKAVVSICKYKNPVFPNETTFTDKDIFTKSWVDLKVTGKLKEILEAKPVHMSDIAYRMVSDYIKPDVDADMIGNKLSEVNDQYLYIHIPMETTIRHNKLSTSRCDMSLDVWVDINNNTYTIYGSSYTTCDNPRTNATNSLNLSNLLDLMMNDLIQIVRESICTVEVQKDVEMDSENTNNTTTDGTQVFTPSADAVSVVDPRGAILEDRTSEMFNFGN